jgi:RNA polymerase sigma factor (sigma-70 family)
MSNESTYCLIESARQGDTEAIQALLLRYQPDVVRFARSVCATPEDAEDAVQEALWVAVQKLGALRVAAAFTTWLFQVVKHECYRLLRRFRHETTLEQAGGPQHTYDEMADQTALSHDVAAAIAALEPHYRQVLIMRDVQAMTAPEVAATLGLTVAAVKSRLHRARVLVRAALQGREECHDQPYEGTL